MQIVIDIPAEDYIRLRDDGMFGNVTTFKRAVREATPLPKGHGRLIDENILRYGLRNSYLDSFGLIRVENVLKNTDTIIEADKAESEG